MKKENLKNTVIFAVCASWCIFIIAWAFLATYRHETGTRWMLPITLLYLSITPAYLAGKYLSRIIR